jgi:mono/diheme cytochrome c family protein
MLGPAPPLNDALFRAIVPEQELESILIHGRKGTLMPAFAMESGGLLTAPQIQVLVKQIKGIPYKIVENQKGGIATIVPDAGGISPKWGTPETAPNNVPSYSVSSAGSNVADEKKGAAVFARACAMCHGSDGQGVERGNETVHNIHDAVFLATTSNQALRRYAITGRQDLGMPAYVKARPGSTEFVPLTDQEVTDLVAFLASWRGTK